jgi:hypothetical protein
MEIPVGGRKIVELAGKSVGIFNVHSKFHAVLNLCPHQRAPLCEGKITGTSFSSSGFSQNAITHCSICAAESALRAYMREQTSAYVAMLSAVAALTAAASARVEAWLRLGPWMCSAALSAHELTIKTDSEWTSRFGVMALSSASHAHPANARGNVGEARPWKLS